MPVISTVLATLVPVVMTMMMMMTMTMTVVVGGGVYSHIEGERVAFLAVQPQHRRSSNRKKFAFRPSEKT
jgi:hypothetical protein